MSGLNGGCWRSTQAQTAARGQRSVSVQRSFSLIKNPKTKRRLTVSIKIDWVMRNQSRLFIFHTRSEEEILLRNRMIAMNDREEGEGERRRRWRQKRMQRKKRTPNWSCHEQKNKPRRLSYGNKPFSCRWSDWLTIDQKRSKTGKGSLDKIGCSERRFSGWNFFKQLNQIIRKSKWIQSKTNLCSVMCNCPACSCSDPTNAVTLASDNRSVCSSNEFNRVNRSKTMSTVERSRPKGWRGWGGRAGQARRRARGGEESHSRWNWVQADWRATGGTEGMKKAYTDTKHGWWLDANVKGQSLKENDWLFFSKVLQWVCWTNKSNGSNWKHTHKQRRQNWIDQWMQSSSMMTHQFGHTQAGQGGKRVGGGGRGDWTERIWATLRAKANTRLMEKRGDRHTQTEWRVLAPTHEDRNPARAFSQRQPVAPLIG